MTTAAEPFGETIARLRGAAGLSRDALAEASGVAPRTISYIEGGVGDPHLSTARKLLKALGHNILIVKEGA